MAYARAADYLVAAGRLVTGGDPVEPEHAAQAARVAIRRLDDAFREHLGERSTEPTDMESIATLVAGSRRVERTALALRALRPMTDGFDFGERCARSLDRELEELHRWYTSLGDAVVDGGGGPPAQHEPDTRGRRRVLQCAHEAVTADDDAQIAPALSLLWASQHLDNLWRLEAHLAQARLPGGRHGIVLTSGL